jgi:uncharacterized protein (DUF433 family)
MTEQHEDNRMTPRIIDRGRGPEIEGTRITVYDVWDYARHGDHHTYIASIFDLSSAEILCALDYIKANKEEVLRDYKEIIERHAKGNPPEVEAILKKSHAKFLALKRKLNGKKSRGTKNARSAGRR